MFFSSVSGSTIRTRHTQRRILYLNSLFWSIGNAMTSSILLMFVFEALGFNSPIVLAYVFASQFLGRMFQPFLPSVIELFPFRRNLCILFYYAQILTLWLLLWVGFWPIHQASKFAVMLCLWAVSNLCEAMACSVFLSWNRWLFPGQTLGRFFSRREVWKIIGEVLTVLLVAIPGTFAYFSGTMEFQKYFSPNIYSAMAVIGTLFILGSTFFLWSLPEIRYDLPLYTGSEFCWELRRFLRPYCEKKFWPFLIYSALFSFFTQVEQVTQITFQKLILCGTPFIPFLGMQALRTIPRFPQVFLAPWVGKLVDRYGTLNVMIFSQILTSFPLLLYAFTKPGLGWFLYLAAIIWGAYVGLNTALPKLQLEISEPHDDTPWLTAYGLVGSISGFIAVFLGGWIFSKYSSLPNYFMWFFLLAFCWRMCLIFPLIYAKRKGCKSVVS